MRSSSVPIQNSPKLLQDKGLWVPRSSVGNVRNSETYSQGGSVKTGPSAAPPITRANTARAFSIRRPPCLRGEAVPARRAPPGRSRAEGEDSDGRGRSQRRFGPVLGRNALTT